LIGGEKRMVRKGFGKKDGNKTGQKQGGRGRNQTDKCRHPDKRRNK